MAFPVGGSLSLMGHSSFSGDQLELRNVCVCGGRGGYSKALACFSLKVLNSCSSSGPLESILNPRVRCKG